MKEKGITLIALVITIIVLMVLAGISIVTLTGENGIISKAREAKEKTEIAEVIEKAKMDLLSAQVENDGSLSNADLKAVLEKYFDGVPKPEMLPDDLSTLTLKTKAEYGSHDITLSDIWNGTTSSTAKTYTVTYDANGGDESSIPNTQSKIAGKNLELPIPIRTEYPFKGWSTQQNSETATYQPGETYSEDKDVTLYAVWGEHRKVEFSNGHSLTVSAGGPNPIDTTPKVTSVYVPANTQIGFSWSWATPGQASLSMTLNGKNLPFTYSPGSSTGSVIVTEGGLVTFSLSYHWPGGSNGGGSTMTVSAVLDQSDGTSYQITDATN